MVQFRRRKGPVTVSTRGLSIGAGPGPLRLSVNTRGQIRRTVRVPGTGLYDTKIVGTVRGGRTRRPTRQHSRAVWIVAGAVWALLIVLAVVLLLV